MMSLSQYLLSKVAEEAAEFGKEVLKGQQQGLFSDHRGRKNYEYIQDEYIDMIARSTLIGMCEDVIAEVGPDFKLLVDRHKLDRDTNLKMQRSIDKMCYYAYVSYVNGHLDLTEAEKGLVIHYYNNHIRWLSNQPK